MEHMELWKDFMMKVHIGTPPKALSKISEIDIKEVDRKRIEKLIEKSKKLQKKKNVFDQILDNFF